MNTDSTLAVILRLKDSNGELHLNAVITANLIELIRLDGEQIHDMEELIQKLRLLLEVD